MTARRSTIHSARFLLICFIHYTLEDPLGKIQGECLFKCSQRNRCCERGFPHEATAVSIEEAPGAMYLDDTRKQDRGASPTKLAGRDFKQEARVDWRALYSY